VTSLLVFGSAHAAQSFLPPDDAFRLSVRLADSATIELRYDIAPGYYLYRERFDVSAEPAAVQLGNVVYPAGQRKFDATFQKDVEVFHDQVVVKVPVVAAPAQFKLLAVNQGCAEKGLCYPPQQRVLKVIRAGGALDGLTLLDEAAGAAWQPAVLKAEPLLAGEAVRTTSDDEGGVAAALRSGSIWSVVGVFFVAGVLLSFTPCVLPMVPILSSIIVGQGTVVSRRRGLGLSLAYALGMALVYTAFGVAAGLAGQGLAASLQNPWVLGSFAALMVVLALGMFGVYELQLPAGMRERLNHAGAALPGGRYGGVFVMGGLSALIVSPCVAAPLAGALVFISQTGDVLQGGTALFALASGMSVPLLLVGLSAGSVLPRAGVWMESVKRFFGFLMLALALYMVAPVLPAWVAMLAWGALLLVAAVFLRVFDRLPDASSAVLRLFKGLGVVLALLGAAQIVGVLSGGRELLQPLAHLSGRLVTGASAARPAGVPFQRVASVAELDAAIQSAGRPVLLDFYADWCVSCKEMESLTFTDPEVRERLSHMLLLQADVTANSADDKALLKRFGLFGPPGTLFFSPDGQEIAGTRVIGFQNAERFLQTLQQVPRGG
jgi:thiol:disulfide interchange protein DsbD